MRVGGQGERLQGGRRGDGGGGGAGMQASKE